MNKLPLYFSALALAQLAAGEAPPTIPLRAADAEPQVALWQAAANPCKPYIAQLFAPGEKPVPLLADSPPDHFHHHGLMLALGVDKTDFWTEQDVPNIGSQRPDAPAAAKARDRATQTIRWISHEDRALLAETRSIRVLADQDPAVHWLVWRSKLTPADGSGAVELNGRHYFGLGLRFVPAFANATRFSFLGGGTPRVVRGDERLTTARACAATAQVDGKPVSLVMFDHPDNPRPALWFTMAAPFAYLAATQGLMDQSQRLAKDETWSLCYGVATLAGPVDEARIASLEPRWRQITSQP